MPIKFLQVRSNLSFADRCFKNRTITTVVIYATKPVGKIVGEFDIEEIISENPNTLWSLTSEFAGISKSLFNEYFRGKQTAYAIKVKKVRRYKHPMELDTVIASGIAPQSFCYLV